MASKAIRAKAMLRGIVKAVPSGDTLVIMDLGNTASTEIPPERTIVLSSLMALKLFGSVFLGDKNVAFYVVAHGWAKLKTERDLDKDKGEFSPYLKELKKWKDKAKENGAGCWTKATAGAVRNLPPSLVGDPNKKALFMFICFWTISMSECLLLEFQASSMRNWIVEPVKTEANGKPSNVLVTQGAPEDFGRESKHFTEIRVLHREVGLS
ncbi:hypothetical protein POM88_050301 [Heracleum sosnowskyi]|uniref:Uncharacterized protein n=1 Tax=Heracleum sosnowskyi TaxID=360622 RepID=A0AAD8M096_9APIA|nr:hypothetical protein POM88_050301 [Heracleum sosnowskyi]